MIRVLIDGRITGHDGIGRYTTCLLRALRSQAGPEFAVTALPPTGTPRYSRIEGAQLLDAVRSCGANVVHVLDYRVPLETTPIPLVVTIHDILRLVEPRWCYSDRDFLARFGGRGLAELAAMTSRLRSRGEPPPAARPAPESLHEEFYARMLAWAAARAAAIITPTETVARQLAAAFDRDLPIRVSAWGIDHYQPPPQSPPTRPLKAGICCTWARPDHIRA